MNLITFVNRESSNLHICASGDVSGIFESIKDDYDSIIYTGFFIDMVSCSFLNGFINHTKIIDAYLLTRYVSNDVNKICAKNFNEKNWNHTNLANETSDDVVVLSKDDKGFYWVFYYDRDCSDCVISRFSKDSLCSEEVMRKTFKLVAEEMSNGDTNNKKFPVYKLNSEKFTGWISG